MVAITLPRDRTFTIGELSRLTGVNIETVRYYEKIKLLPAPPRTEGGRRVYGPGQVQWLKFIRRSRELGFNLGEIRNLLGLVKGGHACGEVQEAAVAHLKTIRRKIADLRRMERTLADTAARCEGGTASECAIIESFLDARPSESVLLRVQGPWRRMRR